MRDHGGNLDWAMARWGAGDWLDLSTGINRRPYPMPALSGDDLRALPTQAAQQALVAAAREAWTVAPDFACLALGGAQAAIQLVPRLARAGRACVLAPTYNEHAACLRTEGWIVEDSRDLAALEGADLAVIVNPNNPDGRCTAQPALHALASRVGLLVVDESFADPLPDLSLLPHHPPENLLVLRSFGKFYGLAGLRLGFAFGPERLIGRLAAMAGPWPVSGPALAAGRVALGDRVWARMMRAQLAQDAARADTLAQAAGWDLVGGTPLFRLYHTPDAQAAQDHLARHHVWGRIFPWSSTLIRLGLPGGEGEWAQLAGALPRPSHGQVE
ncbi:L-threonine O-3-phosphate decarboxylase [Gemmobacter caeni]|uniref:Aminotransferase n=1 Tax=Gemmobacter caeni TaxID=589035 RepID=A0A2T6AG76_9RHOB|nr:threonine-phosphate decarboxylase [Gemmobacter caeni]PTX42796.1 L-threonine O-3-phosphate decarboxylase [Gemmobacter caeni]TWI92438.1 L-threonine O-3-phosphate decarboxylase [Gemmobacter caeni]